MAEPLFSLLEPRLIQSGVWKVGDLLARPLWIDGSNVTFRNGRVEKMRGRAALATSPVAVNALSSALVSGTKRAFLGTTTALYYYPAGGSVTSIRTGLSSGKWSLSPWGNYLIATNDVDRLQLWPNTGSASDISDGPTRARIVRQLNVFTVAYNVDGIDGRWEWSDRGDPTTWTPDVANLAGGDNIRNISSRIQCVEEFGNDHAVFSSSQAYIVSFVGGTAVLSYRTAPAQVGAVGMNCVARAGPYLYGLDQRGFWRTDLFNIQWIAKPMLWDYVQPRIDFTQGDVINAYFDPEQGTIEWNYPLVGGGNEGWAFNIESEAWCPRSWAHTATFNGSVWGKPLGANGTAVYLLGSGVNDGSGALSASVTSKPLHFDAADFYKWVDEFRSRLSGSVLLEVGLHEESPDDAVSWLASAVLTERTIIEREAAAFSLRLSSTAADADWSWAGMDVYGSLAGRRI